MFTIGRTRPAIDGLQGVSVVLHVAASTDWMAPLDSLVATNVHGAIKLFDWCTANLPNMAAYVHTSTAYRHVHIRSRASSARLPPVLPPSLPRS